MERFDPSLSLLELANALSEADEDIATSAHTSLLRRRFATPSEQEVLSTGIKARAPHSRPDARRPCARAGRRGLVQGDGQDGWGVGTNLAALKGASLRRRGARAVGAASPPEFPRLHTC